MIILPVNIRIIAETVLVAQIKMKEGLLDRPSSLVSGNAAIAFH
jgi:hypothetical protein